MFEIGDEVIITVDDKSPLESFNREVAIVREITEDMFGHPLYDVEVDGSHIMCFENEMQLKGE